MNKRAAAKIWQRVVRWLRSRQQWWLRGEKRYGLAWRATSLVLVGIIVGGLVAPVANYAWERSRYAVTPTTKQLVGHVDKSLASQLTYDKKTEAYTFNKDSVSKTKDDVPAQVQKASVGAAGKSNTKTYALDVPTTASRGITYHDTNSQLSFTMVPQFAAADGETRDGHVVFPLEGGNQAVYTLKNNGLKEDIIVPRVSSDTMRFEYELKYSKSLAVRLVPDGGGAIGVYSADPSLFGDISYGSDADRDRVAKAREAADKNSLVFVLPAPFVKDTAGHRVGRARFELSGSRLSLVADGLTKAKTAVTIDPSVVVTSTSDFQTAGNNEGMIDYTTSGQITRGRLTGATVPSWGTTSALSTLYGSGRTSFGSAAYNGYMYQVAGYNGLQQSSSAYAVINADGTLGAWTATTALPVPRVAPQTVIYNGYIYAMGGITGGGANFWNTVYYAPVNTNGTIGTWNTTTSFNNGRGGFGGVAVNGFMYIAGGENNGFNTDLADVQYAPINADGTLGTWTATTSFPNARGNIGFVTYGGNVYVLGGNDQTQAYTSVHHAAIKADGSLGSWVADPGLPTPAAITGNGAIIYNGYIYTAGGWDGTSGRSTNVYYAQLNANGSTGTWRSTTNFTAPVRTVGGLQANNGYLYILGGDAGDDTNFYGDVQYAKIANVGVGSSFSTSANTLAVNRRGAAVVANNGYLYVMGGDSGGAPSNTVYRAAIAADGTIGAFTADAVFTTGRGHIAGLAYAGYMYIIGGCTTTWSSCTTAANASTSVQRGIISSTTGAVSGWTTQTSIPTAVYGLNLAAHNGYVYVIGGINGSTIQTAIYYQQVGASGALSGSWTTSAVTAPAFAYSGVAIQSGYMYMAGGCGTVTTTARCEAATANVYYAPLGASDLTGSFTATNSLVSARGFAGLAISNGYLYVAGGLSTGPASTFTQTYYNTAEYAKINPNGTVGTWAIMPGTTVATAKYDAPVVAYGGYIYVVGGYDGTNYYNNVQMAALNNGGQGMSGTWTNNSSSLSSIYPNGLGYMRGFASNGYMYIAGGTVGDGVGGFTPQSAVYYAPLGADGSIGSWTATTSLSSPRFQYGMAVYNGRVYLVGGQTTGSVRVRTTEFTSFNADGTLAPWTVTTDTDATIGAVSQGAVAVYNGYLYYGGGNNSGGNLSSTQYAAINADGTVSSWTTGTSFTGVRSGGLMVASSGYLYSLSGTNSGTYYLDVQSAPLNASTGAIGSWSTTTAMEIGRTQGYAQIYNGYVYVWGGFNSGGTAQAEVMYAPILTGGRVGNWTRTLGSSNMVAQRNLGAQTIYNGYIYFIGGYNGNNTYTDGQYAPLNVVERAATYSKMVDLGQARTVTDFAYNGTVPGGIGAISYRYAGTNGIFSTGLTNVRYTAGGCASPVAAARYLLVSVRLSDEDTGAFQDADATVANLTDFTVNYTTGPPAPNIRLRTGKSLQAGVLNAYDLCKA